MRISSTKSNIPLPTTGPFRDIYIPKVHLMLTSICSSARDLYRWLLRMSTPSWMGGGNPAKVVRSFFRVNPTNFILVFSRNESRSFRWTFGVQGRLRGGTGSERKIQNSSNNPFPLDSGVNQKKFYTQEEKFTNSP